MVNLVTPFMKQLFVVAGVYLSMIAHGTSFGVGTSILLQLKENPIIPLDDESSSLIGSIISIACLIGAVASTTSMIFCGRRTIHLASAVIMAAGWLSIATATTVTALVIGRFCQGLSMGLTIFIGGVLVGEYSSPRYRGGFLPMIAFMCIIGVLFAHFIGSFIAWWVSATICFALAILSIIIIFFSPESPYYLVDKGKYDEARKVYHWLRGYNEEEEIERIIKTHLLNSEMSSNDKTKSLFRRMIVNLKTFVIKIRRKEIYKPTVIMVHSSILVVWTNIIVLETYATEIFGAVFRGSINTSFVLVSMDVISILSNIFAIYLLSKVKRRIYLITAIIINVIIFIAIAGYVYAKAHYVLPFDHPAIGVALMFVYQFIVSAGTFTVANVVSTEIIPLDYKGVVGLISVLAYTLNLTIDLKYAPFIIASIGVHGLYAVSAGIMVYCLIIVWKMVPETKDKTLQQIQDAFKGSSADVLLKEDNSAAPMTA